MNNPLNDPIHLRLPVKITHEALETFLREKLVGENIKTEEKGKVTNYAQILDLSLAASRRQGYDFSLYLDLKTLTSLFRNKRATLVVEVAIAFERDSQELQVKDFNLQVENTSWVVENSLEAIANTLFHGKLKNRMKFEFKELIQEQLRNVNQKLEESLEAADGIYLSGFVEDFEIVDLYPGENLLLAIVELEARTLLEIRKIPG